MPVFAISTFGCKVNQYESQAVRECLCALGWHEVPFRNPADLYIINSCTVTAVAHEKSRKAARRAIHANPSARVVVTGCAAVTAAKEFVEIQGVAAVLAREQMVNIGRYLETSKAPNAGDVFDLEISAFAGHTRAFVKIEDGCNAKCSYCVVPLARGFVRSRPLEALRREAERLIAAGFIEIVLTGIHLGHYGRESGGRFDLIDAVRIMLSVPGLKRLRLSSLEAAELTEALVELVARDSRFCPHFHLPLQSGDDAILAAMGRGYSAAQFLRKLESVRLRLDRPSFTTDIMVGFPGEKDAQFKNTLSVCRDAGFSRIHIFPFSLRRGTRAAEMSGQIAAMVVKERERELKKVADELALSYKRQFLNEKVNPLVENRRDRQSHLLTGWTERYSRIVFEGADSLKGHIIPVLVKGVDAQKSIGVVSD